MSCKSFHAVSYNHLFPVPSLSRFHPEWINVISRKYSPWKLWQLFCSILCDFPICTRHYKKFLVPISFENACSNCFRSSHSNFTHINGFEDILRLFLPCFLFILRRTECTFGFFASFLIPCLPAIYSPLSGFLYTLNIYYFIFQSFITIYDCT